MPTRLIHAGSDSQHLPMAAKAGDRGVHNRSRVDPLVTISESAAGPALTRVGNGDDYRFTWPFLPGHLQGRTMSDGKNQGTRDGANLDEPRPTSQKGKEGLWLHRCGPMSLSGRAGRLSVSDRDAGGLLGSIEACRGVAATIVRSLRRRSAISIKSMESRCCATCCNSGMLALTCFSSSAVSSSCTCITVTSICRRDCNIIWDGRFTA